MPRIVENGIPQDSPPLGEFEEGEATTSSKAPALSKRQTLVLLEGQEATGIIPVVCQAACSISARIVCPDD